MQHCQPSKFDSPGWGWKILCCRSGQSPTSSLNGHDCWLCVYQALTSSKKSPMLCPTNPMLCSDGSIEGGLGGIQFHCLVVWEMCSTGFVNCPGKAHRGEPWGTIGALYWGQIIVPEQLTLYNVLGPTLNNDRGKLCCACVTATLWFCTTLCEILPCSCSSCKSYR